MNRRPRWQPNPRQELLLEAALAPEAGRASEAYDVWARLVGLDEVHPTEGALLPLLYRNLADLGVDVAALGRLRGTYRFNWADNQLGLRTTASAIAALRRAGIDSMVIKGVPVALRHYGDLGARQMRDSDVLVPRERAPDAISALLRAGFEPLEDDPAGRITVHHSSPFRDASGRGIDLHWYSLWQSAPDDELWAESVVLEVGGQATRAPCAGDALLLTCAHGSERARFPGIRWVADAVTIVRGDESIDWARLLEVTRKRRLTMTLANRLDYLGSRFSLAIPEDFVSRLRLHPASRSERVFELTLARAPSRAFVGLAAQWDRYNRLERLDPEAPREPTFSAQVRTWLGLESNQELGRYAVRRLIGSGR